MQSGWATRFRRVRLSTASKQQKLMEEAIAKEHTGDDEDDEGENIERNDKVGYYMEVDGND